jgi:hypothetical protein
MDFDEVIKRRKMIREFQQDRQISAELIRKLRLIRKLCT